MADKSAGQVRGSGKLIKQLNRSRILECFVGGEPLSRVEVAERTGISLPAVSQLVAELETQQLLVRVGKGRSSGGRRPLLYEYNARLAYIVGLDLGGTKLAGGVSDLEGNLLATDRVSTHGDNVRHGPKPGLGPRVRDFVLGLLADADIDVSKVMGIGIGVPGIADASGREIALAPGLLVKDPGPGDRDNATPSEGRPTPPRGGATSSQSAEDFANGHGAETEFALDSLDLASYLEAELGRPVHIDNDVNMIVRGERWKGALQGVRHGVCITVGTGIGVGVLANGELYRGARGAAGEIGYWLIGTLGPVTRPEGYGPLETFAAGPGIARRYRERVEAADAVTATDVAEAAAAGDPVAAAVLQETVDTLGVALSNLASLLDPEAIVIGGGVSNTPPHLFFHPLRDIVHTLTPYPPRIVASTLGERAGVYGAVAMVVHSQRSSISYMSSEVTV